MKAPIEPSIEDCCDNGCNPCIFDVYEKQLKIYEKYKNDNDGTSTTRFNGILQYEYTSFIVTETKYLCHLHKLIKFKRKETGHKVWWKPGEHFFILYKSDSKKRSCAYTPIKLSHQDQDNFDFSIIVKQYHAGLVSNYLFNLLKGDITLWRGPYGEYEVTPSTFDSIIMIAQGTGVIPFISIIDDILKNEDDMTKILLYYCCRSKETILFREEFYCFKSFWNFSYKIFISSSTDDVKLKYEEPIIKRKLEFEDVDLSKSHSNNQYLICGSKGFMSHYKSLLSLYGISVENIILF